MIRAGLKWVLFNTAVALGTAGGAQAQGNAAWAYPLTFSEMATFVSGDIPESVTMDENGTLYVSVGQTIQRSELDGSFSTFATLPLPVFALGVKVGPDGCVYVASTSLSEVEGAFVWRACEDESVEVFAELDHTGGANDLAFDSAGHLFVTDPALGRVWKVDASGEADVFIEHPLLEGDPNDPALLFSALGVNGIALDKQERFLYLSNTDQGSLLRVDLRAAAPEPSVVVQHPNLRGADGIAFDRAGTLFVAVNAQDMVLSFSCNGKLAVRGEQGLLDAPSSLVFGASRCGQHQLYLTSSAFSRTFGLQSGSPRPALLKTTVRVPGLPLP